MLRNTVRCCALLIFVLLLMYPGEAKGQSGSGCNKITYKDQNQVDPRPLKVRFLKGVVKDPTGVSIPRICLAIFDEHTMKVISTTEADEQGRFAFSKVPVGEYRLVVIADPLCPANARIRIVNHEWRKHLLQAHMKPAGIDTCSYIDFK